MSFKLTEEQFMVQSMVRDLARAEFAPKAMERDHTKEFPADNLKKLGSVMSWPFPRWLTPAPQRQW
jgi:alkylation response protein AidB-like acyl-CoA dehydrogenase